MIAAIYARSLGERITGWVLTIVGVNVVAGGLFTVVIGIIVALPGPDSRRPDFLPFVLGGIAVVLGALAWWGGRRLRRPREQKARATP